MTRLFGLALLLGELLCAQAPTGEITGTVTDPTGAVVAGAAITLTNPSTNLQRVVTTNTAGVYSLPALLPGNYSLKVEMQGFTAQVRGDIELQVAQVARLDFALQVGNVSEVVEVAGGAPVLQTETTEIGTVIENRRILELPLNGRNYLQLASLIPGATTNGPASSQGQQRMGGSRNQFALNVAGQRVHFNHFSLDGIENTDPNFNTYLFLPSLDALQEFKVEAGLFQAEYGRAISQVNVTTKGGTNDLHGSLFEFLRNAKLDAKNFFDSPRDPIPPFKRNQFGATVGGPVTIPHLIDGKNKLFFFFDWESLRERKALTLNATVPFADDRAGSFASFPRAIFDPASRVFNDAGQVTAATQFPGNVIPASRIHPTSATVLKRFYPLPNRSLTVQANNFLNTEGGRSDSDQYTPRIDWVQSSNSSWFFRYSHANEIQYIPINIPDQGNNVDVKVRQGMLANTRVIGPNKVNEFRFGVSRLEAGNLPQRAFKENVAEQLNIPDVSRDFPLYYGIPVFQISGFSNVGECNDCPFVNWDTVMQWRDDFSWNRGKHSFKLGADLRRTRYNQIGAVVPRGRFSWGQQYTTNPAIANPNATTGAAMADFLLGLMNNSESQVGAPIANYRTSYFSFYFQDAWKVTPNLTVNWGLRWENEPPYLDKHDAIVNIDFRWDNSIEPTYVRAGTGDPYEGNPPFRLPSTVKYVRDGRFGRRAYKNDLNDFAPRLGVAYSLNNKTVIRTGAGIYYVRDIGNAVFDVVRNAPFTIRRNEPANTLRPNLTWERPFTKTGVPTFILINEFGEPTSYVGQWSFGVQRELSRDTSLEVTYLGSTGVHLRRLLNYNLAPPGEGDITPRRPFPKFGQFQTMAAPSHSSYHAFQARLQRRFSKGLTVLSSFSFGKSIDNGSGIRTTDGDTLTPSNPYNLRLERGYSAFDFRKRLTTSWLYELPFGRGKRWLSSDSRALNGVFGGWQLGGILTFQDGFPMTARCGSGVIQNGGDSCYPDATGIDPNLPRGQKAVTHFFNTDAFVDRLPGGERFRYGNANRNAIIGPGIIDWDFSAIKNFRFTERAGLEFRSEFFNFPNHPIFAPPGTTLRTSTYGVIGGTKIDSRQIQFGMKFHF
ncbi:MAG: carboxypeptidase regulatory-like domain-containing protein [Acidobacteria bacterium]|nr:carboxypeptidase regulatory-like domain-containing protein [Acidobacteriota bacterium]